MQAITRKQKWRRFDATEQSLCVGSTRIYTGQGVQRASARGDGVDVRRRPRHLQLIDAADKINNCLFRLVFFLSFSLFLFIASASVRRDSLVLG